MTFQRIWHLEMGLLLSGWLSGVLIYTVSQQPLYIPFDYPLDWGSYVREFLLYLVLLSIPYAAVGMLFYRFQGLAFLILTVSFILVLISLCSWGLLFFFPSDAYARLTVFLAPIIQTILACILYMIIFFIRKRWETGKETG
jgi:hypothetical protein